VHSPQPTFTSAGRNGLPASGVFYTERIAEPIMAEARLGTGYREKAAEMRQQAARAETPDLRAMYVSIALEWKKEADVRESGASDGCRTLN
jgi:hypothetical protein